MLGAMMISPAAVEACSDLLGGREFYRSSHGAIFQAIVSVYARGESVDAITVTDELRKRGDLNDVGGPERVRELAMIVPAASNARHWAKVVRENWLARGLIRTGQEICRLGFDRPGPIEDLIKEADGRMSELQSLLERKSDSVFTAEQLVAEFREKLANPIDEDMVGVSPPFQFLSPLMPSRLYVLGGYQGDGKTALALQFLRSACEGGARVGFASIEMSRRDLTERLISTFGIPYTEVRTGRVLDQYRPALEDALSAVGSWNFEVIDDEAVDPVSLRANQRRGRYDMLIVDHLHRIRVRDKKYERQELEDGVRRITNIAREFEIPVLLLSQLSRAGDIRNPFPRPTMASLRGSAMIEAEAAVIWFVWRKRDKNHNPGSEAELIVAKNRFGPIGFQNLWFHGSQVRFNWQTGP